jgi:hypothetical protein
MMCSIASCDGGSGSFLVSKLIELPSHRRLRGRQHAGDRGVRSRHKTAALPFRLSPWTCDSASPAELCREGIILG